MFEQKTKQMIQAAGDATVRVSLRKVRIESIILREDGLPALFVARYLDSYATHQYFFYKDELAFPSSAKTHLLEIAG
jgi:hypothetical protein